jgi:hypothetical protein
MDANNNDINQIEDETKRINNFMLQSRINFHEIKRQTNQSIFENRDHDLFSKTI